MDRAQWAHEYGRLCRAFSKDVNPEQAAVYFDALRTHPHARVGDAVSSALREMKRFPPVADLLERIRNAKQTYLLPARACDVCGGSTWTIHKCTPEMPCGADHPKVERMPVYRPGSTEYRERPYMHDYARRCYQCWQPMEQTA